MNSPKQGDIIFLDFNPQSGHEQAGKRPALVVSEYSFNKTTGFAVVCPITNQTKGYPFEVPVSGTQKTTGYVLSDQFKSLDIKAWGFKIVDSVDDKTLKLTLRNISLVLGLNKT